MSDEPTDQTSRRTFMKGVGLAAGAATLGISSTGTASAAHGFDAKFANWRVREASKVWARGYTGHPERSIALTDSGVEARHPDLGPWNGIQAEINAEGNFVLVDREASTPGKRTVIGTEGPYTGTLAAGGPAPANTQGTHRFTVPDTFETDGETFDGLGTVTLEAQLSWSPSAQDPALGLNVPDNEFYLDKNTGTEEEPTWERVASAATGANPESIVADVTTGTEYRFVADTYATAGSNYEASGDYVVEEGGTVVEADPADVFAGTPDDEDGDVTADTPKTVGWYDAGTRYGSYDEPLDGNGHGTHCASIMGGSGRASRVDPDEYHEGDTGVVLPTDVYAIEVSVDTNGGVFGAAYGEGVELFIEGPDGQTIETGGVGADASLFDNTLIDHPAVHDSGTATYTVYARPYQPEGAASTGVARLDEFVAGATLPEDNEGSREGVPSLHAGVSPNSSIVGLQGLGTPTVDFGKYAEQFTETFNIRAVNMSWGYLGGAPLGGAGGLLDDTPAAIKQIAQAGVLTCAAAGNTATPANGNGAPAVADECISVVSCDPVDGLVSYSSGGLGGVDEDEQKLDMKPDVSAPGGAADGYPATGYDLVRAARNGTPGTSEDEQVPIRDYTLKAGTSMAAPYVTGVAGLVSEAMEFDAPSSIALPEPKDADLDDTLRLKQVILATATQTAFTAAPFHHPTHRPDYQVDGGRDPFEGYGRVNPDAAVDAVTRPLVDTDVGPGTNVTDSYDEVLGLNVPEDSRAVAGYVEIGDGDLTVDIAHSHYSGGNKGMALDVPHLDLFVYDAENPATNGEPNVLASAMGMQGTAEVSVSAPDTDTVYVVAKLVNVPGGVNTNDIQSHFELNVDYTSPKLPLPSVGGSREDDGRVFTSGQTNTVKLTVNSLPQGVSEVRVTDFVPDGWDLMPFGDYEGETKVEDEDGNVIGVRVDLGRVSQADIDNGNNTVMYFAEASGSAGQYTFGPGEATIEVGDTSQFRTDTVAFTGTDTNTIAGADQNELPL